MKTCSDATWITSNCWNWYLNRKESKYRSQAQGELLRSEEIVSPSALRTCKCWPCGTWGPQAATYFATPFPSGTFYLHLVTTATLQLHLPPGSFFNGLYFPGFCGTGLSGKQLPVEWRPQSSPCWGARLFLTVTSSPISPVISPHTHSSLLQVLPCLLPHLY